MYDGNDYWLWDGFHRLDAHKKAGCTSIRANVKQGTRRDAVLASVGANNNHGLRRTNDDKRRAVITLLNDAEWVKWSDREIAQQCKVSHTFVGKMRQDLHLATLPDQTYIDKNNDARNFSRNGKTYEMGIGRTATPPVGDVKLTPPRASTFVSPQSSWKTIPATKCFATVGSVSSLNALRQSRQTW